MTCSRAWIFSCCCFTIRRMYFTSCISIRSLVFQYTGAILIFFSFYSPTTRHTFGNGVQLRTVNSICGIIRNTTRCNVFQLTFCPWCTKGYYVTFGSIRATCPIECISYLFTVKWNDMTFFIIGNICLTSTFRVFICS